MDYQHIYSDLDCFSSFKNDLIGIVKTYYFGLACKLEGEGKLLTVWFKLIEHLIDYGKVAVVSYGKYLLFAQIVDGYNTQTGQWAKLKLLFIGDKKGQEFTPREGTFVIFTWGSGEPFTNLSSFGHDVLEMWHIKGLIGWDQDKSKKRIIVEFERDPGKDGWKNVFNSYESENGFVGIIAPQKSTNPIKKWEHFAPRDDGERQKLRQDLKDAESRFFFKLGMRHNPFSKEERQNNPEVMSGQAYFDAWETKIQGGLIQGILDFQGKEWGGGTYILPFGSLPALSIENKTVLPLALVQEQNRINQFNQPFLEQKDANVNYKKKLLKKKKLIAKNPTQKQYINNINT